MELIKDKSANPTKILSIDFDCIMSPCIKLYNDKCFGNENPTLIWRNLSQERNIDNFLCYDAKTLEDITLLIQRAVNSGAVLIPITEHQNIIDNLDMSSDQKIDVVNIDFHHDIWYNEENITMIEMFDEYNCANWVGYLIKKNKLNSYTWYKMPNSDLFHGEEFDFDFVTKRSREIKDINEKFDVVYFCLSPQWVPYKYHHLYHLIVKLFGGKSV